jgi:COP9 signalosome complex subunit 6
MTEPPSSFLVSSKPSDSGLHVQLHPLVLLTISDHITRHTARQLESPIVGGLLGQTQGRDISVEYAFQFPTTVNDDHEVVLVQPWFEERLKQCGCCTFVLPMAVPTKRDQNLTDRSQTTS